MSKSLGRGVDADCADDWVTAEAMARPVVDEGLAGPRGVGRDGLPDLKDERRFCAEDLRLMAGRACSVFWDIRVWQRPGSTSK